jgi:hypothetical protein
MEFPNDLVFVMLLPGTGISADQFFNLPADNAAD